MSTTALFLSIVGFWSKKNFQISERCSKHTRVYEHRGTGPRAFSPSEGRSARCPDSVCKTHDPSQLFKLVGLEHTIRFRIRLFYFIVVYYNLFFIFWIYFVLLI